jgi:hypothetical protein
LLDCPVPITITTSRSEALLEHTFTKADLGKSLQCLVRHIAYRDGEDGTLVSLDVLCEYWLAGGF